MNGVIKHAVVLLSCILLLFLLVPAFHWIVENPIVFLVVFLLLLPFILREARKNYLASKAHIGAKPQTLVYVSFLSSFLTFLFSAFLSGVVIYYIISLLYTLPSAELCQFNWAISPTQSCPYPLLDNIFIVMGLIVTLFFVSTIGIASAIGRILRK